MSVPILVIAMAACLAGNAVAEPYLPARDGDVLEQLARGADRGADRAERAMRTLLARDPTNLDVALRLAQAQVASARAASDPRRLGQAQATLAPWWDMAAPPAPVLLLRATIRQSGHEFAAARADLQQLVAQDPDNAQAWLTLAAVQQVGGELGAARQSCEKVSLAASPALGTLCGAAVDSVNGRAASVYAELDAIESSHRLDTQPVAVRTWAATLRAELAERLGRAADAESGYRYALSLDPADAYATAAYADFLLDAGRAADVTALIAADTPVDNLLLRRALAERQLGTATAAAVAAALAERFAALRERGDRVHLREEARFRLLLEDAPAAALELAMQNWAVQKEPLDARIALECALAAGQPRAADPVLRWIEETGLEGARLDALAQRARE